ncbi:hypothetical protein COLO4_08231 [Corchorus olitorius]|uniref:Uncharacterized protein n=1 Tax=Corchorus olitorius TaxID=93759 RepID=A0A1R3KGQ8_9ROSI|nr:hypothetical protein COLO4_08231 [Corchorus olitorius]
MGLKTSFILLLLVLVHLQTLLAGGVGSFNVGGGGGGRRAMASNTLTNLGGLVYKYDKHKTKDKASDIKRIAQGPRQAKAGDDGLGFQFMLFLFILLAPKIKKLQMGLKTYFILLLLVLLHLQTLLAGGIGSFNVGGGGSGRHALTGNTLATFMGHRVQIRQTQNETQSQQYQKDSPRP